MASSPQSFLAATAAHSTATGSGDATVHAKDVSAPSSCSRDTTLDLPSSLSVIAGVLPQDLLGALVRRNPTEGNRATQAIASASRTSFSWDNVTDVLGAAATAEHHLLSCKRAGVGDDGRAADTLDKHTAAEVLALVAAVLAASQGARNPPAGPRGGPLPRPAPPDSEPDAADAAEIRDGRVRRI